MVLTSAQKDRIRAVFQQCNRNLYTNLEDIDHPDHLYYDGHLTIADLKAIVAVLQQCQAELDHVYST